MSDARQPGTPGGPSVLLVDDDQGVRLLLATTLRSRGYHVIEASSGSEALALHDAHGHSIRLLITDVVMPDLRGPALASRIRQTQPGLPVLFITGYNDRRDIGADDLLMHKPFTPHALANAVKSLIG
jgi:two-component system, cell cycle sensor histidine kinase and response regulator CckA